MKLWKYLSIILGILILGVVVFFYTTLKDVLRLKFEQKEKEKLTISLVDENFQYLAFKKIPRLLPKIEKLFYLQGFNLKSTQGNDGFTLLTTILTSPKTIKWAQRVRKILGTGELEISESVPQESLQINLGIDLIAALDEKNTISNLNVLLNATSKAELSDKVITLLEDKGLKTVAAMQAVKKPITVIAAPKELEDKAVLVRKTLGVGQINLTSGLGEMIIYLGEDYLNRAATTEKTTTLIAQTTIDPNQGVTILEEVVKNPDFPYWAVIDKSDFELRLYTSDNQLVKVFSMAYGMDEDGGNKRTVQDNRTPDGDFFICQIQNSSYWAFEGDVGAYGPFFLRLKTPPWQGIGIHGTNHPETIGTKATHGCIRLHTENLLELKEYADLGMPVKIQR